MAAERPRMLIAGASGVVGAHLVAAARAAWDVSILSRNPGPHNPPGVRALAWDPREAARGHERSLEAITEAIDGADLVVNLAGSSLADGRLDARHKRAVLRSRLDATRALVLGSRRARQAPATWFQASAVGYYGDTGEAEVDEQQPAARNFFLAEVCEQWEAEARKVEAGGTRLIIGRIGLVLAGDAPAWQKLLLPIRLGVGGPLGSGQQWWPWIDADDVAGAILHLADRPDAAGVYNLVAPQPVRQIDLVRQAAERLGRPAFLPAPAFALRLAVGEVADALLLPSCHALPARLASDGYKFISTDMSGMLDKLLA